MTPYNATNITSATTTTVKTGKGILRAIVVNTTAAGTIKLTDSTDGATGTFATLKASVAENTYHYNIRFATGLTIVTGAASDVTVVWE